jgi:SAM-dependent methyltransferase
MPVSGSWRLGPPQTQMLTLGFRQRMFLHQDGFVLGTILRALQQRQIVSRLLREGPLTVGDIAHHSGANPAYLHAALRCLAQQDWCARSGQAGTDDLTYWLTQSGVAVSGSFPLYCELAEFVRRHLPFERSVLDAEASNGEFDRWIDRACDGWFDDTELEHVSSAVRQQTRHHLDGQLTLPIMMALWSVDELGRQLPSSRGFGQVARFLQHLGWMNDETHWTADGQVATAHALHYGMVGSYCPMLTELSSLLFGGRSHRTHDLDQGEWHVDRRLNVLASAAAHKRYFVDADDILIDIFSREPLECQPRFVADSGCGDGSWLQHIYDVVASRTARGRHLDEYPLLMIGTDYNAVAREVARGGLAEAEVPALIMFGDITDPNRLAQDLREQGLNIKDGLHIRAFVDHNRRYRRPTCEASIPLRDRSSGAYIDEYGRPIPNELLEQDLTAFLARWVPHVDRHGLIILEAHCVAPCVAARHQGDVHNIVFDTYHALSLQYPVDFQVFMDASEAAGLQPVLYHQSRYPSRRPFVSISSNYFVVPQAAGVIAGNRATKEHKKGWQPEGSENLGDGEALHRLLYHGGDLRRPRAWCSNPTALLLRGATAQIERKLDFVRDGGDDREITVLDYGTGTGFAVIELLKILQERRLIERMNALGISMTIHALDMPSGWFAQGYLLLRDCPFVKFASTRTDGSFARVSDVLEGKRMDLAIASMVFHLVPPRALRTMVADLAEVLKPSGRLLWHAPDIGPSPHDALLFHDPNRLLRRTFIACLDGFQNLDHTLAIVPPERRSHYRDLPCLLRETRSRLSIDQRATAQTVADRQILPVANTLSALNAELEQRFNGGIDTKAFEIRDVDALDAILVPSNQRYLQEIDDLDARRRLTTLLMQHAVMPEVLGGPAATTYGFSVHWTLGEHTLKP